MKTHDLDLMRQNIDAGVKAAVAAELEEHRLAGRKVAVWRDGKVVLELPQPPSSRVREEPLD